MAAPTDADKQIRYLAAALKAPRIVETAARLADQARDAGWTFEDYLAAFGREVLLRWNLTRDGQPEPVSEFSNQPMAFCMDIIGEWYRRSGTVPAPLVPASSNGNRSAEKLGRTVRSSPSRRK